MARHLRSVVAGLVFALSTCSLQSQKAISPEAKANDAIHLDVLVTNGSNKVASGLPAASFKVLDNGVPRDLLSFSEVATPARSVRVLIVVDAVNTPYMALAYQRDQILKFLRADGGRLTYVTTFAVVTDKGVQVFDRASKDGNDLAAQLEHYDIGLRIVGRSQGFYGAQERLAMSLDALRQIAAFEQKQPGRKLVVWVSPGWPLLSGVNVELTNKEEDRLYKDIAAMSTQLRTAGITLNSLNSWGASESLVQAFDYEPFLDGVSKPAKAQLGNLGLQVLATQSGGLVLNSSDVVGMLRRSVADAMDYYELSFAPVPSEQPNEYHRLEVEVDGMKARTRQSYYTQPAE